MAHQTRSERHLRENGDLYRLYCFECDQYTPFRTAFGQTAVDNVRHTVDGTPISSLSKDDYK